MHMFITRPKTARHIALGIGAALFAAFASPATAQCPGDCDGNGRVSIAELLRGVNIALELQPLSNCPSFDVNSDGRVAINELVAAVNAALGGCPSVGTPTNTPTATRTPTNTPTMISETCGDGVVDAEEECDDGKHCLQGDNVNQSCEEDDDCDEMPDPGFCSRRNGDGCQATCALPVCGDGVTDNLAGTCQGNVCVGPNSFAGSACTGDADCAGETCDDGNTTEGPEDTCPANCRIAPCTPSGSSVDFNVNFTAPQGVFVAGIQFFIRYPDGVVSIPGSGTSPLVVDRIASDVFPSITANDRDFGVNILMLDSALFGSESGTAATITFDRCDGSPAPTAADFSCTLVAASDTNLLDISDQVTCGVAR